jgi:hypothetical protein
MYPQVRKETQMTIRQTVAASIAMALCAVAFAGTASAGNYPSAASKAMGERYQAMARHYLGTGAPGIGKENYSRSAATALGERYETMAHYYQQAELAQARRDAVAFDWGDAGVGALAATGAVALLGLGALGIRSRGAGRPVSRAAS